MLPSKIQILPGKDTNIEEHITQGTQKFISLFLLNAK